MTFPARFWRSSMLINDFLVRLNKILTLSASAAPILVDSVFARVFRAAVRLFRSGLLFCRQSGSPTDKKRRKQARLPIGASQPSHGIVSQTQNQPETVPKRRKKPEQLANSTKNGSQKRKRDRTTCSPPKFTWNVTPGSFAGNEVGKGKPAMLFTFDVQAFMFSCSMCGQRSTHGASKHKNNPTLKASCR